MGMDGLCHNVVNMLAVYSGNYPYSVHNTQSLFSLSKASLIMRNSARITWDGHTSTSCQAGAKERFQQITEAYEALKACIRQSRVGCRLEPFDCIFA